MSGEGPKLHGELSRQVGLLFFFFFPYLFSPNKELREINCFKCRKLFRNGILGNTGEFSVSHKINPSSANAL